MNKEVIDYINEKGSGAENRLYTDVTHKSFKVVETITNIHLDTVGIPAPTVCICGSSKYSDIIAVVKWILEKNGIMATGLHYLPEWYFNQAGWSENHHGAEQEGVAETLDKLHIDKIKQYKYVLVVNYKGYIGKRTSEEIEIAKGMGKQILYLEPIK